MPRGDEIEPGEPRRKKSVPPREDRDDRDDDDRNDDEDVDDYRPRKVRKRERSGLVMSVGILAIIFASLNLVCGICGGLGGVLCAGGMPLFKDFMKQAAQDPNFGNNPDIVKANKDFERLGPVPWLMIAEGVFNILYGAGLLAGGIFVLRRSNVGRFLTLAIAVIGILGRVVDAGLALATKIPLEAQGWVQTGAGIMLSLAFAAFAGFVLLTPRYAKEFA